ncbi:MAG: hypothetical protein II391_04795 [Kiritimatiellae bacterium]|nr:hypothetical protein [Kiritimatiellia bacterium]
MMKRDVLIVVLSTAAYGAVLAAWRSPLMAAYVAVKLPVVFVATTLVVSAFCWAAGLICRAGLRYREVLGAVFSAMAVAGSILLALSPVVLYFVFSGAPDAGTREEMRFAHATMMMVHILVLACAGATGNLVLCRALRRRVPPACRLAPMVALWIASFAVVGCQLGWIMRPLVGSPNIAVEFLRSDALDSNFLESLFRQIIPHIISKGAVP